MLKRVTCPGICAAFAGLAAVVVCWAGGGATVAPTTAPVLAGGGPASAPATSPSASPPAGPGGQHTFADFGGRSRIVFVCDRDVTLDMNHTFEPLKEELAVAACAVRPGQSFNILLLSDGAPESLSRDGLLPVDNTTPRRVLEFLGEVNTGSTPDPIAGLRAAFRQQPDLVYFLTDGDQPNNKAVLEEVRKLNADRRVRVNTVAFVRDKADATEAGDTEFLWLLQTMARESGGEFRLVEAPKLGYGIKY